jgi:hypothetical protein
LHNLNIISMTSTFIKWRIISQNATIFRSLSLKMHHRKNFSVIYLHYRQSKLIWITIHIEVQKRAKISNLWSHEIWQLVIFRRWSFSEMKSLKNYHCDLFVVWVLRWKLIILDDNWIERDFGNVILVNKCFVVTTSKEIKIFFIINQIAGIQMSSSKNSFWSSIEKCFSHRDYRRSKTPRTNSR